MYYLLNSFFGFSIFRLMIPYTTCFNAVTIASDLIWKDMLLRCVQIICTLFCLHETKLLNIVNSLEGKGTI